MQKKIKKKLKIKFKLKTLKIHFLIFLGGAVKGVKLDVCSIVHIYLEVTKQRFQWVFEIANLSRATRDRDFSSTPQKNLMKIREFDRDLSPHQHGTAIYTSRLNNSCDSSDLENYFLTPKLFVLQKLIHLVNGTKEEAT